MATSPTAAARAQQQQPPASSSGASPGLGLGWSSTSSLLSLHTHRQQQPSPAKQGGLSSTLSSSALSPSWLLQSLLLPKSPKQQQQLLRPRRPKLFAKASQATPHPPLTCDDRWGGHTWRRRRRRRAVRACP